MTQRTTTGETAVVVGVTGAFGKVIAARLLAAGLTVVGVARDGTALAGLQGELGPDFLPCTADIGDDTAVAVIAETLPDAAVAMVVHSVGLPVAGGVANAPPQALTTACNLKAAGFLRLVRAVEGRLRRGSRLVAIGGHYGFEPSPYAATAGVANAALANLVRQMSWAYGAQGITAHLLAPGPADTDRLRKVAAARAERAGKPLDEEYEAMRGDSAIHAFTTPEQVAWAVNLLLAPEADALAGSTLGLDSGRRHGI
ncbi:SDR family oxidoreductase [Novosphingobium mangrovi (ex Huang et al. 2023)]|uniref:SDR family oxidoreductase n=1 Tax=Novosphingobium mangrovi (ex Huang et al. 2023) TaxID=2976432 RepID=A0ABT2I9F1_9SPHN|nr:SDR family oxidoreductase [Novosphingobium mangrovi (ex Huang et al. 2023)]MCT2401406.1 SDR family oxidoreductase [Novosphingobium mangrovi (ex Huang et al. 2023)]